MNQTAYDNDIPTAGDFRGQFLHYQQAVNRAVREFLLRYPNSSDREQVEWLLAFTNTLDRRDSDEWLVAEIARRINNGWLNPADLNSGLEPLGFVGYPALIGDDQFLQPPLKPVLNLFGDGLPAYIWEIQNSQEGYYGYGMFLAVEQLPDDSFREEDVSDGDYIWEYDQKSPNGSTGINITNSSMFEPVLHRKLIWNGEWFQIAGRRMELPENESLVYDMYQRWIGYAMEYVEFNGIQPLFEYLLENPPEEQGGAFPDFIRFQMAMAEALSSRVEPAREQLQGIVDSPADPTRPMVAKAAAAFLKKYQSDADIFQSCHEALSVVDRDLKPLRNPRIGSEEMIKERGFYSSSSLCSPRAALRLLLRNLSLKTGEDVTARPAAPGGRAGAALTQSRF